MTPKNRNRLIVLLVLAIPVVIFIFSVIYNASTVPPLPPMPAVNGYDDLTNSTSMLAVNTSDYADLSQDDLQTLVARDSAALQLARAGLEKQCQVPLDYSPTSTVTLSRLEDIKRLGQAFAAEGRLAQMQGRTNEAVKSYLDVIHLGNESARGGVLIDQLIGSALEKMGTRGLRKLLPQLDAQTSRKAATALETLDAQRQTWPEVMQQESDWSRRAFPGLRYEYARILERNSVEKIYQKIEHGLDKEIVSTRQLIVDLAARAYGLDKGHPPTGISDLVPDYLKAIPQDPFTGTNIVYLPQ